MKKFLIAVLMLSIPALAEDAANGKKLFEKYGCYTCHGHEGQGGPGVKLAPQPRATAAFVAYVRHPGGSMPPYTAKVLSDAELNDIHAFLASVKAPPALKDIPLLNQ